MSKSINFFYKILKYIELVLKIRHFRHLDITLIEYIKHHLKVRKYSKIK
jgi:hypothetical protein